MIWGWQLAHAICSQGSSPKKWFCRRTESPCRNQRFCLWN